MSATTGKKGSKFNFTEEIKKTVNQPTPEPEATEKPEKPAVKNKCGRPSNGEVKKISLAIPVELYEGMETGANLFFKGNKTAYINALIKKDLDENLGKYEEFKELTQKNKR